MKICSFFGHRDDFYAEYKKRVTKLIASLIEIYKVDTFYSAAATAFDALCATCAHELKQIYSHISVIRVLTAPPKPNDSFYLPFIYDRSVCLIAEDVPRQIARQMTEKAIVDRSDCVISGILYDWKDDAANIIDYARNQDKLIFRLRGKI